MKTQLAALELHYLIKELQILINSKVDKIYHPAKYELILNLHSAKLGKQTLKINTPQAIFLSSYTPQDHKPSQFCMFLRKYLDNTRLRGINQKEFERIIEFVFEAKEEKYSLIIEMFSKGNILLLKNNVIISAIEYQKWKDRTIRPNIEYIYPKKEFNFLELTLKDIKSLLKNSNKESLVKCLALDLGLGGVYAEEACLLAKLDKNSKPAEINRKKAEDLLKILKQLKDKEPNPLIIYKDNQIIDIVPFKLEFYKDLKQSKFKTYNEALNHYFFQEYPKQKLLEKKQIHLKEIEKIEKIVEKQKQKIRQLETEEKENRKKAELIYEKYQLIDGILNELKKAMKKYSLKEIKEKLRGHKIIKELNEKEKSIIIEI